MQTRRRARGTHFLTRNMKFSCNILAAWEEDNGRSCVDTSVRRGDLEKLIKMCGLSPSGDNVATLRVLLQALRKVELPVDDAAVKDELEKVENEDMSALKSRQQRARRLLYLMDPALKAN